MVLLVLAEKKISNVDFAEQADLFDYVGLGLFLEEKLNRKVDVVPQRALRVKIQENVLREVVIL